MQARQGAAINYMSGCECKPGRAQPLTKRRQTNMFRRKHLLIAFTFFFLTASLGFSKDMSDERDRAMKATEALTESMQTPDNGIPQELMERAYAVAVIPNVVKGAFGLGGRYGKGLVSHRGNSSKWSTPSFI